MTFIRHSTSLKVTNLYVDPVTLGATIWSLCITRHSITNIALLLYSVFDLE